mgnify:CR=1 FL=1
MDTSALLSMLPPGTLFSSCSIDELNDLVSVSTKATMKKGQTLMMQGDVGDSLIILLAGNVRVTMVAQNGREITLDYAEAGAVLGEISVIDGGDRTASVIALNEGSYLHLTRSAFASFVERQPPMAWRFMKEIARRLRQTNNTIESDRAFSSGPRLARFLQRLTLVNSTDGRLKLALSQSELGSFAGMSRENINRQLSAWADSGIIELDHGHVRILDSQLLSEIAEASE